MKRVLIFCLLFIMSMSFSGCLSKGSKSDTAIGQEQAEKILRCFDENNIEELKNMFCQQIANTHNLDDEIKQGMLFFHGKTISHDKVLVGGGESVRNGKVVDKHIWYNIENIKCNTKRTYFITTASYLTYVKNNDYVGITYIIIYNEITGEKLEIGENL